MSLYLGKIHYWLFNKILWFENLESDIIILSKNEGLNIDKLLEEANNKYGTRLPNKPLEEMIDTNNIHGWLQEKIHSAEGRMAFLITKILKKNIELKIKIEQLYSYQGDKAANEIANNGIKLENAVDLFNSINDYILDGMPCDRVNEIIKSEENIVEWKRRICVHKDIWNNENGDVNYFYYLRKLWTESFVNKTNSSFKYIEDNGLIRIEKI